MNREEIELINGFFNEGWCCDLNEVYSVVMKMQQENQELKDRIDKAIDLIEETQIRRYLLEQEEKVLKILIGDKE